MDCGETLILQVKARNPYSETEKEQAESKIYNETINKMDHTVMGKERKLTVWPEDLPQGAVFEESSMKVLWTPEEKENLC